MKNAARSDSPIALDLYAGAGGLSQGFLDAGFDVRLAVDQDPLASATHKLNHAPRGVEVLVEDLSAPATLDLISKRVEEFERPLTLVCAGPPCQGFSRANVQTRTHGNPNNAHVYTYVRYIERLQPKLFLMENVGGLQVFDDGELVTEVLTLFRKAGYDVDVAVLNAAEFGVPQQRHRVFFLGNRIGILNYFPTPILRADRWVTVGEAIRDLPVLGNGYVGGPLSYKSGRPTRYSEEMRRDNGAMVDNNWVSKSTPLIVERYSHIPQGGNWRDIPDRLMRNYADKSRCHQWIYKRLDPTKPAVVITNYRKSMLIHPDEDRGLSVREAARLQSFPDNFIFTGGIEYQQQQVANAVPPLLARAVASTIMTRMIRSSTPRSALYGIAPDLFVGPTEKPRWELSADTVRHFRGCLRAWANRGLRDLPWRRTKDAYHILVSEMLLQKTTASQVESVYREVIRKYPTVHALARANARELRSLIAPLGLPDRAKRMKRAATVIVQDYHGMVPQDRKDLARLAGVGPYVAAATTCFAYRKPVPLVDSNIIRIFQRVFGIKSAAPRPRTDPALWQLASRLVPREKPDHYHQALVDFGALVCTHRNPLCGTCPLRHRCEQTALHANQGRAHLRLRCLP